MPTLSLRTAAWALMQADVPPFRVSAASWEPAASTAVLSLAQHASMCTRLLQGATVMPTKPQHCATLAESLLLPPLQVGRVLKPGKVSPAGVALPVAEPGTEAEYFYSDAVHPSGGWAARMDSTASRNCRGLGPSRLFPFLPADNGHQVLAELLAGAVMQAAENVLQTQAAAAAGTSGGGGSQEVARPDLPPPMVPGNADSPTSLCSMQVGL